MTNTDGVAVPEPGNDKVWESWVQDLLSKKHGDTAVAYGRPGQKQHGIDFVIGAAPWACPVPPDSWFNFSSRCLELHGADVAQR